MRHLLLLLLVANVYCESDVGESDLNIGESNLNIGGRCLCDECLVLDGEPYTLSNNAADMRDKCQEGGCLMTNDKDKSETCICHGSVSVADIKHTEYEECMMKHIPQYAYMSSLYEFDTKFSAINCINKNKTLGGPICHTALDLEPYLKLDMGVPVAVTNVVIYDDDCSVAKGCEERLQNVEVWVGGDKLGHFEGPGKPGQVIEVELAEGAAPIWSQWIDVRMIGPGKGVEGYLHLQEVEVWGLLNEKSVRTGRSCITCTGK